MNETKALEIVNNIFNSVFESGNPYSLDEILNKFAFDIKLPKQVNDFYTNEITWAASTNNERFITLSNMNKKDEREGWILPKQNITNLDDLLNIWYSINLVTTERVYDSIDVIKSDTIYSCRNVYHSSDCRNSQNIIYCDSCGDSEYLLASQRSGTCTYCIRVDDSKDCSNSYSVICSSKISNSFFIQDCFDLYECMFCSHISSKKYCIANMQFDTQEYYAIKKLIINWILTS